MWMPKSNQQANYVATNRLSRRSFIVSASLIGGALVIGCKTNEQAAKLTVEKAEPPISPFEAYLALNADGSVTVYSSQFDMGQNVYHGLATLVAEELEVDLSRIRVEGRAGNPKAYGNPMMGGAFQLTGGSSSMPGSYERYRNAGAAAREMLKAAAAKRWNTDVKSLSVENGVIRFQEQTLSYAELLADAAMQTVPIKLQLKNAAQFKVIGKDESMRLDAKAKSDGTQQYTIDIKLPKQLTATVLHGPRFGSKVKSVDDKAALAVPGVVKVIAMEKFVAVVANNTWAALQGKNALQVSWDEAIAEARSGAEILADYVRLSTSEGKPSTTKGDSSKALSKATQTIEALYQFPYLAHAAMEPLNAVVHKEGETLHLYGGLQMPDVVQGTCAEITGVKPENIQLHVMQSGGGFGRRAVADSDVFVEACLIAKAMDYSAPIQLQWSREADMSYGRYRPAHVHRVKVGIDAKGEISGWQHHVVGQSILKGTPFESMMKDGVDNASVEGVSDTAYQIKDMSLQVTHPENPISVLWWRSVGHTHTAYVMETMIDEIAVATKTDPVVLRLKLLPKESRHRKVLELAAEKAGWKQALPANRFRGIAVHESFGSFVATVAELSKAADGTIKVERCVVASDCGIVINPDVVRAQIEGGTGFGLGAILSEEVSIDAGAATVSNYDGYRCLRMDQMPQVEVHMLASSASPTGIGECAVPPIGPAFANALFQATGVRLRNLPYQKAGA
jgi:isoquinoline 1-oxidoreductase subunit beta